MNILLVDDHEVVRRGVRDLLSQEYPAAGITEAQETAGAITLLKGSTWDLVLLDINLPGRSGLEVLAAAQRICPSTPVLVLSMYPESEFAVRAFKLGASAYVSKASAGAELLVAIQKVLAGGKYVSNQFAQKLVFQLGGDSEISLHEGLSIREFQVLRLVALGHSIKEIALELESSEKTISTYRVRLGQKLRLSGSVEIARYALQHGLVK